MLDQTDKKFIKEEIKGAVETAVVHLVSAMDAGFKDVSGRLDKIEGRLDKVEEKLDKVEVRLVKVEEGLQDVKCELSEVKVRLTNLETDTPSVDRCQKNEKRITKLENVALA